MLVNKIAIVTGASRGGGKGIALALGDAGATVYVTGRSSRAGPVVAAPMQHTGAQAPGTVEDTAEEITCRGGRGIPVVCDHTDDAQVLALFERVQCEQGGRLDLLVNAAWGGNELPIDMLSFWELPVQKHWDNMFTAGVRCALMASQKAAAIMLKQRHGLIINVTAWDDDRYTRHFMYDLAKASLNRMAFGMAQELQEHKVAALALAPGWMRTERVLEAFGCVIDPYCLAADATAAAAEAATAGLAETTEGRNTSGPGTTAVSSAAAGSASMAVAVGSTDVDSARSTAGSAPADPARSTLGLKHWTDVPDLKLSESPMYLGRAVVALAGDPEGALAYSERGKVLRVADLAKRYGFKDLDGTQPAAFVF